MRNPYAHSGTGEGAPDPTLFTGDSRIADYEAAIGPNSEYYRPRFEQFDASGPRIGWHWPAFFATSAWFIYRRMWLVGVLNFFYPVVVWIGTSILLALTRTIEMALVGLAALLLPTILLPMFANQLYWKRTRRLIDEMPSSIANDPARRAARLEVQGGVGTGPLIAALAVMTFLYVGVIGILAALAIPAYQDYTIRAQVTEGLNLAGPLKAAVAEYYAEKGAWPEHTDLGIAIASGKYVDQVVVQGGSVIIVYGRAAHKLLQRQGLAIAPAVTADEDIVWVCGNRQPPAGTRRTADGPAGSDLPNRYLPANCRPEN